MHIKLNRKNIDDQARPEQPRLQKTKIGWIPEGWEESKLGEIAKIKMGQSPDSKYYNNNCEGVPLIQGNADCIGGKTSPKTWTTSITKTCEVGDIILSVRAPVGSIAKSFHKACIGRGVCVLRGKKVDNELLYQMLLYLENRWGKFAQGSTFTAVNSKDIKFFKIRHPQNIKEQQKIATILSIWDKAIELVEKLIAAKRRLKKGLMQQLLTGKMRFREFKNHKWQYVKFFDLYRKIIDFRGRTPKKLGMEWGGWKYSCPFRE